nr:nuclear transport factor 2 family protein [uncultured Bacteroides sp.]
MKKILLALLLFTAGNLGLIKSQTMNDKSLETKITELEDRLDLKKLVDTFSVLADQKDAKTQALLFTDDAEIKTYVGDNLIMTLNGRNQIEETFENYLNTLSFVYHINGQQTVDIKGDHATGISYCQVTLSSTVEGKNVMTMQGVYYNDEYKKVDGIWKISKRTSHFVWRDSKTIE